MRAVGPHLAMAWFKTVSGQWATTKRVRQSIQVFGHQEPRRHCIFGCGEGRDEWKHCSRCVVLWSIVQDFISAFTLSPLPIELLGFFVPNKSQIIRVAFAYFLYHAFYEWQQWQSSRAAEGSSGFVPQAHSTRGFNCACAIAMS